jgi:hypothetical protein
MFCFLRNFFKDPKLITNRKLYEAFMELAKQVADALQSAKDNQVEVSGKLTTLLEKMEQLKEGATKAEMEMLLGLANDVSGGVQAFEDKLDAAQSVTAPAAEPVKEEAAPVVESETVTGDAVTGDSVTGDEVKTEGDKVEDENS